MPNYASVLNDEIARIARKEVKAQVAPVAKRALELRKKVSSQARQIAALESKLDKLEKELGIEDVIPVTLSEEDINKARVSAKYIANVRNKYELSRNDMALLLDVNANSIYLWETGRATPRNEAKAKIIQLRDMGKRKVNALLDEFID